MKRKKRLIAAMANSEWRPLALGPLAFLVDEMPPAPADLAEVRRLRACGMYVEGLLALDDVSPATQCAG